ncbi:unnamed protein product [Hapterophycus canaliculatus]
MWPDERESLDEDSSLLGNGGGSTDYLDGGKGSGGNDEGPSALAIEAAPAAASAAGDDNEDVSSMASRPDREETCGGEEGMGADGGLREEWDEMTADEKLSACLAYLRASYSYCMYCACQYNGSRDLQDSCPGPSRDDHDEEEL